MASILVPFTSDGVEVTNGDLIGNSSSPAPNITGFYNGSFGGNINATGNISAGGSLDIDGEGTIGGNLVIVGNIDFSGGGSINQITSPYGYFTGNSDGSNALYAGVPGGTIVPNAVAQFTSDANAYTQINAQNKNHGTQASMEWVVTGDLGTDTSDYLDIGFSSSTWDGTQDNSLGTAVAARDGWMYVQGGGGGGSSIFSTTASNGGAAGTSGNASDGGNGSGSYGHVGGYGATTSANGSAGTPFDAQLVNPTAGTQLNGGAGGQVNSSGWGGGAGGGAGYYSGGGGVGGGAAIGGGGGGTSYILAGTSTSYSTNTGNGSISITY